MGSAPAFAGRSRADGGPGTPGIDFPGRLGEKARSFMIFRFSFLPLAAAVTLTLCLAPGARAKFLSPPDVVKEPELAAVVETLKKAKTPEESKAAFAAVNDLAAKASSAERQFFLAYLYQYGLGTEAAIDKASP